MRRNPFQRLTSGHYISFVLAFVVLCPLFFIFVSWLKVDTEIWQHLIDTSLTRLLKNSLILMVGVGITVSILGVSLAYLVSAFDFPLRRTFTWLLMLPLAIPTYVLAFVTLGLFDFFGPIQEQIRVWFNPNFFVDFRHPLTLIIVLSLVLYPYVYMLARVAFLRQGPQLAEAAKILGSSPLKVFFKIKLPLARPAIVAGLSLALMETLADFGAVAAFNFDTFTTAIYKTWYGLFNIQAAAQLASLLLLFVTVFMMLEKRYRQDASVEHSDYYTTITRPRLSGFAQYMVLFYLSSIVLLAFVLPLAQLLWWAFSSLDQVNERYFELIQRTLILGFIAAILTASAAMIIQLTYRKQMRPFMRPIELVSNLGYALPGSILAVGIMLTLTVVDQKLLSPILSNVFSVGSAKQWLSGSVIGLILAYIIRFMAVAQGPIKANIAQMPRALPEAAQSLGCSKFATFFRVELPLLRTGILTALLLVMVDVMKEMPATMLLRPFGWDTLAVRIYELTSEGQWERAAFPALTLVLIGLLPVIWLIRKTEAR